MRTLLGDPALRLLARRKLRGRVRMHLRRLKTWKGLFFTLAGVAIFGLWIASLVVSTLSPDEPPTGEHALAARVRFGALLLSLLSISGAFAHRGLYMPGDEVQRLLAAPVRRSDLVRYRLLATSARGVLGGLFLGLVVMRHMPVPAFGFAASFVAVVTLPVANQLAAILAGSLEKRLAARLASLRTLLVLAVVALGAGLFFVRDGAMGEGLVRLVGTDPLELLQVPPLVHVTAFFAPWERAITAKELGSFLPWFGFCLLLWAFLFELTARLRIDFRELSMETSASVAARIRRVRRGGGAASGDASRRLAGWRVPWLFGRGAFGALAWRKSAAIVRKAKGTLLVSVAVLGFVMFLATTIGAESSRVGTPFGSVLVAVLGTLYLCAGLRFDFRDELDRMEVIKAWPIRPATLFCAMLVPEVVLVSGLLVAAVLFQGILSSGLQPITFGVAAVVPLVVFAWVALDNAVFLLSPVRLVPGQDGALQNAGRGLVMMLVRVLLAGLVGVFGGGAAWGAAALVKGLGGAEVLAGAVAVGALWIVLLFLDVGLALAGGAVLRRFDVARDRGL